MLWRSSLVDFDVSELPVGASLIKEYVGLEPGKAGEPREVSPLRFRCSVKPEIENLGGDYRELRLGCITAGEMMALFNLFLLEKLGQFSPTRRQRKLFSYLFENPKKHMRGPLELYVGNVCDTLVDYNDPGKLKPKKGFSRAAVISRPETLELVRGRPPKVVLGRDSELTHFYVPSKYHGPYGPSIGYVKRTRDGAYHPCGLPFDITPSREKAERTWTDASYPSEFAELAVSEFRSWPEGHGLCYVERQYFDNDGGVFYIAALHEPPIVSKNIGRLAVVRTAKS